MVFKTTDSRGRITLGDKFANRTVIVEAINDTEVRIKLVRIIPEREVWLHANPRAKAATLRGLTQAKRKRFAKTAPNLAAASELAARLQDKDA